MTERPFRRLALIGVGLIGSSIARAARAAGLADEIVANARTETTLAKVRALELADRAEPDPARAVEGADLVILCTPVGALAEVAARIAPCLAAGTILSDVGSTKQSVIRDVEPLLPQGVHFVPAHPVAGTEFSGPEAGFAELFQGRWTILTPLAGTDETATARVERFWRAMGAMTARMEPGHHDRVLAIVSHLPHLIAFTICNTADHLEQQAKEQVLDYAASGFRDFTRIAASDPTMWRDVFLNNREALLEMLARFNEDVQAMARAVRWGDAGYIEDSIARGRRIRQALIEKKQA
ncbi:MAG: prephenate/arogenate dehydrogenase family protein [Acetobacteraceae bacterium]|nr:prephenate/arogenate dehydrogenase family protein [Acetobacteraceae bacterium]